MDELKAEKQGECFFRSLSSSCTCLGKLVTLTMCWIEELSSLEKKARDLASSSP
jgi:hypothetical protein